MWLQRSNHKRRCSFCLALLGHPLMGKPAPIRKLPWSDQAVRKAKVVYLKDHVKNREMCGYLLTDTRPCSNSIHHLICLSLFTDLYPKPPSHALSKSLTQTLWKIVHWVCFKAWSAGVVYFTAVGNWNTQVNLYCALSLVVWDILSLGTLSLPLAIV